MNRIIFFLLIIFSLTGCVYNDTNNEVIEIISAFAIIEKETDKLVTFEVVSYGQQDIIMFKKSSKQFKGLTLTTKFIMLSDVSIRTIMHELGHELGLMHEHQRPDRNQYIYVDYKKLYDDYGMSGIYSFEKTESQYYNYKNYEYDYQSIMHYNDDDCKDVIYSLGHILGNQSLSEIDIKKTKDIYKDNPRHIKVFLYGFDL